MRGQVGEDLEVRLEAGDEHEQQRQAEDQARAGSGRCSRSTSRPVLLLLAGLVDDRRRWVASATCASGFGASAGILVTGEVALDRGRRSSTRTKKTSEIAEA